MDCHSLLSRKHGKHRWSTENGEAKSCTGNHKIPWILAIAGSPYHPEAGGTMENMQLLESRGQDSPMGIRNYCASGYSGCWSHRGDKAAREAILG